MHKNTNMSTFSKERIIVLETKLKELVKKKLSAAEIAKSLGVSSSTIRRYAKKLSINLYNYHNELKFDNTVFDVIDTEEKAYWLGFLYADGNVGKETNIVTLSLAEKDLEHLLKFKKFIHFTGKIYRNSSTNSYRLCVCDKYFKKALINKGCVPAKSLILKFPEKDIFKREELLIPFIRGYIDGDGCLTFGSGGRLSIQILGTKEFLEEINKYLKGMHLYKIKRLKTNTWTLNTSGNNADRIATLLYKNANIYLERKFNRFVVLCRNT